MQFLFYIRSYLICLPFFWCIYREHFHFSHIAIWCSTSRLCNSTGTPPRSTLVGVLKSLSFAHSYCCYPLLVLSLLVQSFPSPPCSSSQDDGRSPRVDHHCFIFAFSQTYGAISLSLSPCLRGQ